MRAGLYGRCCSLPSYTPRFDLYIWHTGFLNNQERPVLDPEQEIEFPRFGQIFIPGLIDCCHDQGPSSGSAFSRP